MNLDISLRKYIIDEWIEPQKGVPIGLLVFAECRVHMVNNFRIIGQEHIRLYSYE